MIYYFAYGSNLHPLRLKQRVPSAELVGVATHPGHMLGFHKKSNDGSGKCNMYNSESESALVYGAIYKLEPEHKDALDGFEGKGSGYMDNQITLTHDANEFTCFTYFAQQTHIAENLKPYHWYKQLVVSGAQYLKFPDWYVAAIAAVESIDDPDPARTKQNELLIKRIISYR